ncbi:MAG: hypothetical protein K6E64_09825 [Lachnospiraceae bacterium]|nr:hypothetical protein [Lachnospiraceae bacterium]
MKNFIMAHKTICIVMMLVLMICIGGGVGVYMDKQKTASYENELQKVETETQDLQSQIDTVNDEITASNEKVDAMIEMIDTLNEETSTKEDVKAVLSSYNELTENEKASVTNKDKLVQFQNQFLTNME